MERLPAARDGERLPSRVARFRKQLEAEGVSLEALAGELGTGAPTLRDILENLEKPGLDPRESLPKPILRKDVLKMEDLKEGMVLQGTVRNVVDFGAFVDIGVKQDGLVHVSEMADRFVRNPLEVAGRRRRGDGAGAGSGPCPRSHPAEHEGTGVGEVSLGFGDGLLLHAGAGGGVHGPAGAGGVSPD